MGRVDVVSTVWKLVIEQGYSRRSAATKLGIPESRVDRILNAVHARRKRLAGPERRRAGTPCAILLEDDPLAAEMVEHMLAVSGIRANVIHASCKQDFIDALERDHVDVVISDSSLVDIKPLKALQLARQRHPQSEFFILSGRKEPGRAAIAKRAGVAAYVEKRRMTELMPLVENAIKLRVAGERDN